MAKPYKTPGVYVEEISTLPASVAQVPSAIPAFLGYTAKLSGEPYNPAAIGSLAEYRERFGEGPPVAFKEIVLNSQNELEKAIEDEAKFHLHNSISMFYQNGGGDCYVVPLGEYDAEPKLADFKAGLKALKKEPDPTLIVMSDAVSLKTELYTAQQEALMHCAEMGNRFCIFDLKNGKVSVKDSAEEFRDKIGLDNVKFGAAYTPWLSTDLTRTVILGDFKGKLKRDGVTLALESLTSDVHRNLISRLEKGVVVPPSGAIAGVYASVDNNRGVWKAPANVSLSGVVGLTETIDDKDQELLNVDVNAGISINAIRAFIGKGILVWGARTLAGNDNEWRYVPVRRLFIMVEESIRRSTGWVVFEPNDANTWIKVKAMIENYLIGLWRDGALAGATPDQAFFVNVGLGTTMTTQDILEGRMIIEVGMAAIRPAEFVILRFSHKLQEA